MADDPDVVNLRRRRVVKEMLKIADSRDGKLEKGERVLKAVADLIRKPPQR